MRVALMELVFMMVILKLPIVYLCAVVYWAIRAEPEPLEGAPLPERARPPGPRRPRGGPERRSPGGRPAGRARVAR
jgi:hypothetical protein